MLLLSAPLDDAENDDDVVVLAVALLNIKLLPPVVLFDVLNVNGSNVMSL